MVVLQGEFNFYLVLKDENVEEEDKGVFMLDEEYRPTFYKMGVTYRVIKDGARIYPIGYVVPVIQNDKAVSLVYIVSATQFLSANNRIQTSVEYETVLEFKENDPIANHYTSMYEAYKKKQEIENHGGKFKIQDFINALERKKVEDLIKKQFK